MTTLISAEVNQLTLLVSSMVLIFSTAAGEPLSFLLDNRQAAEFLLTAAVSLFAILLIFPRRIPWVGGLVLLLLFLTHLPFTEPGQRNIFTFVYLGLSVGVILLYSARRLRDRLRLGQLIREVTK